MGKFSAFFKPQKLGFHLVLALIITALIIIITVMFLNRYTRHGQEVYMPNFIGENSNELVQNAENIDFIIEVSEYVYDKKMLEGTVLKQDPQLDEKVKKGRKVYLTVASSTPPKVKMPELQNISLRQAEIMLQALKLELEGVIYKPSPFENAVLEQLYKGRAIAPGTEVSVGDKITLVVGKNIIENTYNESINE